MDSDKKGHNFYLIECPNCGKQVETDGSTDDKCYWCHELLRRSSNINKKVNEVADKEKIQEEAKEPDRSHPEGWIDLSPHDKRKWYDEHMEQIRADCEKYGIKEGLLLWGVPESRWNLSAKKFGLIKATEKSKKGKEIPKETDPAFSQLPKPASNRRLELPEWSEGWNTEVKIAWLNALVELRKIENNN